MSDLFITISNSTAKRELSLGKSFKLDCDVKPYSEVKWYKNDKLFNPNQTNSRISIKNRGKKSVVKVKNAKNVDVGLYKCYGVKNGKKVQIIAYNVSSVPSKYWLISIGF